MSENALSTSVLEYPVKGNQYAFDLVSGSTLSRQQVVVTGPPNDRVFGAIESEPRSGCLDEASDRWRSGRGDRRCRRWGRRWGAGLPDGRRSR